MKNNKYKDIEEYIINNYKYDSESGEIYNKKNKSVGSLHKLGYVIIQIKGSSYYSHLISWFLFYGKYPEQEIDHINGNKSDNKICNLREVSKTQNLYNKKIYKNNTSGYKGVIYYKTNNKWQARISINRKRISLGYFNDVIEAAKAYDLAAIKYFGEFAKLNFEVINEKK